MKNILLINKPAGWTSFDVVAKIRSLYRKQLAEAGITQKAKVGHAGTLDPFATGLLIVLLGAETKNQDSYMKKDKEYLATLELGATSDTGDPEGSVTSTTPEPKKPSLDEINKALEKFKGEIEQTPPAHSAIKINGKRAYELARKGEAVELKSRKVIIRELETLEYDYPMLKIRVACSSGTYIRSLAQDIGAILNTGAYLTALRRTKIEDFSLNDALEISDLEKLQLVDAT